MTPKILNILLLTISAFLYFAVIDPLYSGTTSFLFSDGQSFKSLIAKRDAYDKTIAAVDGLIKQANDAEITYQSVSPEDKKKILTMVPISINDIKLMNELTNIGNLPGNVPIEGMGIKDRGNGEYTVDFNVTTTYSNFDKIIRIWENSMRLFTLQSVSFGPGKTEDEPTKFNIEFYTYYMK